MKFKTFELLKGHWMKIGLLPWVTGFSGRLYFYLFVKAASIKYGPFIGTDGLAAAYIDGFVDVGSSVGPQRHHYRNGYCINLLFPKIIFIEVGVWRSFFLLVRLR